MDLYHDWFCQLEIQIAFQNRNSDKTQTKQAMGEDRHHL